MCTAWDSAGQSWLRHCLRAWPSNTLGNTTAALMVLRASTSVPMNMIGADADTLEINMILCNRSHGIVAIAGGGIAPPLAALTDSAVSHISINKVF